MTKVQMPVPDSPSAADPRWQSVRQRDAKQDGQFVYAVITTGIYCRPSCPSRQARPQNLRFYAGPREARAAGFRACQRCDPDGPSPAAVTAARVAEACRLIEAAEQMPKLAELAAQLGLSPFHFHRMFRATTGLTPRQWAAAERARRVKIGLQAAEGSVTSAIYEAGFGSNRGFYEQAPARLGMTAQMWKRGGDAGQIHYAQAWCNLGALLVAQTARGICAITLGDAPEPLLQDLQQRFPKADLQPGDAAFGALVAQVVAFVEAPRLGLELPLDIQGTAFQERVWQALRQIPAGQTASYAQIAERIGSPQAVRAVAGACAANRLAVAIPCHRILRSDGALSGYRWGVARKRALLDREAEG